MIVKPKIIYRILKAIVNFLIAILFMFIVDRFVTSKLCELTTIYKNNESQYISLRNEYQALEDYYGLYTYDSENHRIKNEDADVTAFNNDSRVKQILIEGKNNRSIARNISLICLAISYTISIFIVYLVLPIFSKKNYDFGSRAFNIVVSKNGVVVNKRDYYGITLIYILFHLFIGVSSLFILNLIDLLFLVFNKKKVSLIEKLLKFDYAIDFDKVESELVTEEKLFEQEHSYNDETPRDIIKLK